MTDEPQIQKTELELSQEKVQENLNNWKRAEADFANYKKEEAKRIESALQFGNEKLILEVLDVVDGLEVASHHAPENTDQVWLTGLKQVLKQFAGLLEKHDVRRIPTLGEKFDPLHHEAVQMIQAEGPPETVVQEIRAGYVMHGKVIRPSRVIINK